MMPITMTKAGDSAIIKKINGKDDVKRHLETLGFTVGEAIIVINEMGGNLILNIKGSRVAINKTMANRILV